MHARLVPIAEYRRQKIRRLAFRQPRPDRYPQFVQQRRLFLRGGLLPPGRFRLQKRRSQMIRSRCCRTRASSGTR